MREQKIPLFAVESQDPIKNFDFLGITIQYEMCYTNILQVLELSQIPLHAEERTEEDPIVIGGGPCTYNPEPIAPFFDLFYMGEGEVVYFDLIDRYKEIKARGGSRKEFLEQAAQIPGIYVPGFYDVTYKEDGTIEAMTPNNPHAPQTVSKQLVMDMSDTWLSGEAGGSVSAARRRTVWFSRSCAAVSADAVSARRAWSTARCASAAWRN